MNSEDRLKTLLKSVPKSTYTHPDKPGAGAKKRKKLKKKDDKVEAVMGEYKRGTLHSGSGHKITDRKQAIAIAMSEAGLSNKAEDVLLNILKAGKDQLKIGKKIEAEHTKDPRLQKLFNQKNPDLNKIQETIAKQHIEEFDKYYTYLVEMEKIAEDDAKRPAIEKKILSWLNKHPNPEDDDIHAFAAKQGWNKHKFEEVVYKLATERAKMSKDSVSKARQRLLDILKAKYIRRYRDKGGKYRYEYAKPGQQVQRSELKDKPSMAEMITGFSKNRMKELTGSDNPSVAEIRNSFDKMTSEEKSQEITKVSSELNEAKSEIKKLTALRKDSAKDSKSVYTDKIKQWKKIAQGKEERLNEFINKQTSELGIFSEIAKVALQGSPKETLEIIKKRRDLSGQAIVEFSKRYRTNAEGKTTTISEAWNMFVNDVKSGKLAKEVADKKQAEKDKQDKAKAEEERKVREAAQSEANKKSAEAKRKGTPQEQYEQAKADIENTKQYLADMWNEDLTLDSSGKLKDIGGKEVSLKEYKETWDEDDTELTDIKHGVEAAKNLTKLKDAAMASEGQMKLFARVKGMESVTNKLLSLLKARTKKYIRRYKGKDGNWKYEYAKPGQQVQASKLEDKPSTTQYLGLNIAPSVQSLVAEFKRDQKSDPLSAKMSLKTIMDEAVKAAKSENRLNLSRSDFLSAFKAEKDRVESREGKKGHAEIESEISTKLIDAGIAKEHAADIAEFIRDKDLDVDSLKVTDDSTNGYYLEVDGEEWFAAKSYDDAFAAAKEDLENLIDDMGVTAFNESFWQGHVDEKKLGRELSMDSSVYFDDGYDNPSMYLDEEPAGDDGDWTDEQRDRGGEASEEAFTERVTEDPLGYLDEIYGEGSEEYNNFIQNYVDIDELITDAIKTDGIAHTLGRYDGNEYEHGDMLFYQQN